MSTIIPLNPLLTFSHTRNIYRVMSLSLNMINLHTNRHSSFQLLFPKLKKKRAESCGASVHNVYENAGLKTFGPDKMRSCL